MVMTDLLPSADQSLPQPTMNTALSTSSKLFLLCLLLDPSINGESFQQEKACKTSMLDILPFNSLRP